MVVEERSTALRGADDLILDMAAGTTDAGSLIDMAEILDLPRCPGSSVFEGAGMGRPDPAVAESAKAAWLEGPAARNDAARR